VSRLQGRGRLWDGFVATKIFILLKKIVVDVGKNDIPQFLDVSGRGMMAAVSSSEVTI